LGRPAGSRNSTYEEKRRSLAKAVFPSLLQENGHRVSMRELAVAAKVSVPTLRHYFGDRDGVVAAALLSMKEVGDTQLQRAANAQLDLPLEASLLWVLSEFVTGWMHGVGQLVTAGLLIGANSDQLGPAFVDATLEPTLQSFEQRLAAHQALGHLAPEACPRAASLALVCPVILGLLHQVQLRGSTCRALDLDAFLKEHVHRFTRGWGT
jgi:AcrR family transcriptional regulator